MVRLDTGSGDCRVDPLHQVRSFQATATALNSGAVTLNGAFNPGDGATITGFNGGPGTVTAGMAAAVGYNDGGFDVGISAPGGDNFRPVFGIMVLSEGSDDVGIGPARITPPLTSMQAFCLKQRATSIVVRYPPRSASAPILPA